MLLSISIISLLLLIWFRTEAWLEYTRLFGINFLSFYKDYDVKRSQDITLTYHIYLRRYHDCFFVRLITCPICVTIWIALLGWLAFAIFATIAVIAFGSPLAVYVVLAAMVLGCLLNLPWIILGSLAVYGAVEKLIG